MHTRGGAPILRNSMDNTIRIASWTIVAGSLLVLGRTLFVEVLPGFSFPDVDATQVGGTVIESTASGSPEHSVDAAPSEQPVNQTGQSDADTPEQDDDSLDDKKTFVLNGPS